VKRLFDNISFSIDPGDKIALVGVNGCGKTTLLSQLAQAISIPHPNMIIKQGLKAMVLHQAPAYNPDDTLLDHLFKADTPTAKAVRAYHACLEQMETNPSKAVENQLSQAMEQMDLLQAWAYEDQVASVLKELNIHHMSQLMKTLSGGMIKKVALAQLFFEEADLLILDEPTNHLDIDTITWLENRLKRLSKTIIMVTHDRYFLDRICTKILEIDQCSMFVTRGNYHLFLEQREQRYLTQHKEQQDLNAAIRLELEWLRRGPKARSTKQKARKQRAEAMINQTQLEEEKGLELEVAGRRLGKKILELKQVAKTFENKTILRDFSYTFKEGEKIGILGPNGAGKTTLFNLITERLFPDSGIIDTGVNTAFGYFDQTSTLLNPDISILDHVKDIGEHITLKDGSQLSAAKLLERFLFPSSQLKTKIGKLSGGEKRRLDLVCMLLRNPNFLLFDEPTNDLDINTLSVLENFLLEFRGCALIISHDRYFMDRVVDQLFIFNGQGDILRFWGSYTDYADSLTNTDTPTEKKAAPIQVAGTPAAPSKKGLSYKEQQELSTLEKDIEKLETEKADLEAFFTEAAGSLPAFEKAGKRMAEISTLLETKLKQWEKLAEKA
jgi:ATP-binding cassette subfamily F protein uup